MLKNAFFALIALALSLAVYLYFYLGFYKPVDIEIGNRGPLLMFYQDHIGAYHLIGPKITEVEDWVRMHAPPNCEKTFGEYIDDPASIDQDRLRSRAGCILSSPMLRKDTPYKFEVRDEASYVVARFSSSPSIGPIHVYPKVRQFIDEHRLKVSTSALEIYKVHGKDVETELLFKIEK